MRVFLKKMAVIFGFISFAIPVIMLFLWHRYIEEQTLLTSQESREICEPYDFTVDRENDKLLFSWETEGECSGFILLGSTYSDFSNLPYKVMSTSGESPVIDHEIVLQKQDEIKYKYAIIVSEGEWYGIQGVPFVIPNQ